MKFTPESPTDRSAAPSSPDQGEGDVDGDATRAFTLESIQQVRDFTARKTLEQAHAFVTGLRRVLGQADADEAEQALLRGLDRLDIGAVDAAQIAAEAVALIEVMADRDRKADIFHAAVQEAGQSERAMYERLATLARVLRAELDGRSPALGKLGVPSLGAEPIKARSRPPGKAIFSAVAIK